MNSRERVLAAIDHKTPDRVPVDFWADPSVKQNLCNHLGLNDEEQLLQNLGVDIRCIYPEYVGPKLKQLPDGSYEDFWGVIRSPVQHEKGIYYEVTYSPLSAAKDVRDVERCRWPSADWFDYSSLTEQCEQYHDYAVCVGKMGRQCQTVFIQTWYTRGLDQILLDMSVDPAMVDTIVDKIMEFRIEHVRRIVEAVEGKAQILQLADDYGSQNGLLLSLAMWRRFFRPALKIMTDLAHRHGLAAFLHCCGSVRDLIPDLIELGIDILNPIQVSAKGMDPRELKEYYGKRLCFHGSIDTQHTLPFGSEDDVAKEVRSRIDTLGKDGGFILAPVHTIESDVPLSNIISLYEAAREYGLYAR